MIALLSGLSISAAIFLAALAMRRRDGHLVADRIAQLKQGSTDYGDSTPSFEAIDGRRRRLDDQVERWVPPLLLGSISRSLTAAGQPATIADFVIIATLLGGAFAALPAMLVVAYGGNLTAALVFGGLGSAIGGFGMPMLWLRKRVNRRRSEIWRSLPDAADLLTTCVEAGLDINASFARVALEMPGPFQEEVKTMMREVSLGRRRRDALTDIGIRCGVDDLTGMLTAIIQAEESGTTLAPVLRAQSRHIRAARRLFAEQRARTVPAKMTFPIIFLIVPTLFMLILAPVAMHIWGVFNS